MAAPNLDTSGIASTTGAALCTLSPLYSTGTIWYVLSTTGSDAASPRGKQRERPLATLVQAITNAAAGDIIVCLSGHTESIAVQQAISTAGLLILGDGAGSNRPKFTRTADIIMWNVTGAGVHIENIYFPASTLASTSSRVKLTGVKGEVAGCYFECGTLDNGPALETATGASQVRVAGSTYFVSTSTSVASAPDSAIRVTNAITDFEMDTVIMDGAASGWANPYALNMAAAVTRLRVTNLDLLNGSEYTVTTGTTGYIHSRNVSGSNQNVWPA